MTIIAITLMVMYATARNSRALGLSIVTMIGVMMLSANTDHLGMLAAWYIICYLATIARQL